MKDHRGCMKCRHYSEICSRTHGVALFMQNLGAKNIEKIIVSKFLQSENGESSEDRNGDRQWMTGWLWRGHVMRGSSEVTPLKPSVNRPAKKTLSAELQNVFDIEEIKSEVRFWRKVKDLIKGPSTVSNSYFERICGLCLANPKEQKWLVKFRWNGMRRLNLFLLNNTKKEIQSKDIKLLTWSCLSLLSFYYTKRQNQADDCMCFRAQKFDQAKALLRNAMYLILPEKQDEVIKYTIKYFTLASQWNTEDYDLFVFKELLTMITKPELLLAKIMKQIETSQREDSITEAFNISCTLSTILEHSHWDKYLFNHLLHNCFNTLLKVYLLCNKTMPSNLKIQNAKFRMTIKTCIKNFITNIKDNKGLVSVMDSMAKCLLDTTIAHDDRFEITEMIAFCAQRHQTKFFRESITPDLLELLLNNLLSPDKSLAMASHKIIHRLLDRHGNLKHFSEPVYYFKGRSDLQINYDFGLEDIHFFKSFSKKFLEGIQHCFLIFSDKYSLVLCHTTLCLILVEVPEPVISIHIIHLLITIQNNVLEIEDMSLTVKAHIHAIIAAIISLICIIHKDEVNALKRYVEEVVRFRTENSPHLLPPLQNKFTVASHHTSDYHDQLYFLEEEVLYALQRCWLNRRVLGSK